MICPHHVLTLSSPEVSLFGLDVGTDIYNGVTLIQGPSNGTNETRDGRIDRPHPIWGWSMVGIPFLPAAVGGGVLAVGQIQEQVTCCGRLGLTLLSILLAVPFIGLVTPAYIAFVLYKGLRKVADPKYDVGRAAQLKTLEITIESALQTCLGNPP